MIQTLETASEKVARMITATGVTVRFDKRCKIPMADSITLSVILPPLPDVMTPEETLKLRGALDHEIAHILWTRTKEGTPVNLSKYGGGGTLDGFVINVLEDWRVNKLMGEKYQGSMENIMEEGRMIFRNHAAEDKKEHMKKAPTEKEVRAKMQWIALQRAAVVHISGFEDITEPMGPTPFDDTLPEDLKRALQSIVTHEDVEDCLEPVKAWLWGSKEEQEKASQEAQEAEEGDEEGKGDQGDEEGDEEGDNGLGDDDGDDGDEGDGDLSDLDDDKDPGKGLSDNLVTPVKDKILALLGGKKGAAA
jgi:hypothetical protein